MESELGTVGKVDRTWWWVFGSQALLALAGPVWMAVEHPREGVEIICIFLLVLVAAAGCSGFLGDLVVKWFPRKEWLFVPVVAITTIVGASLVWGGVIVVVSGFHFDFTERVFDPIKALVLVPTWVFESIEYGLDLLLIPMLTIAILASLECGLFLAMCLWKRSRLWRMAFTFAVTLWVVTTLWCAAALGAFF